MVIIEVLDDELVFLGVDLQDYGFYRWVAFDKDACGAEKVR